MLNLRNNILLTKREYISLQYSYYSYIYFQSTLEALFWLVSSFAAQSVQRVRRRYDEEEGEVVTVGAPAGGDLKCT